jgi:hypothetical protein
MIFRPFVQSSIALVSVAALSVPAFAQSRQAPPSRKADSPARSGAAGGIQGFSVVLVVGSAQGTGASDGVPEAARKALADMKDFLPYKRYQLIDASWMLCCASFQTGPGVSGRMRGPDNREYSYTIEPNGITDGKVNLRFSLREITGTTPGLDSKSLSDSAKLVRDQQLHEAVKEAADATLELKAIQRRYEVGVASQPEYDKARQRVRFAEQRVAELEPAANGGAAKIGTRAMIDSTFAIMPGETVVIGTSRVAGDQALIALLTAATRPASTR